MEAKKIYNLISEEDFNDAKIINGNPSGIINFEKTNHKWATSLWDLMESRTWFPKEINVSSDKTSYPKLTEYQHRSFDLVLAQLITNDSIQTNQLMDSINRYITSPVVNACLSRQAYEEANHCFTEGTQILTSEGFIDFKDLTMDHLVANWNEDKSIHFEKPSEVIKDKYTGSVYEFTGSSYSLEVTPNHRVINYNVRNNNKLEDTFAEDIGLNNRNIPINGYKLSGEKKQLSFIDKIRIAYQADGSLVNNNKEQTANGYCYRFSFKKKRKILQMENILLSASEDLNTYSKTETKDGYTHFYLWLKKDADKEFNLVNLNDISFEWCQEFIAELKNWDGCYATGTEAVRYGNTNKKAVDKIIEIATLCGKIVGIEKLDPKTCKKSRIGKNKQTYYNLYIRDAHHKSGRAISKIEKHYDGMIYCCTVSSGMIIVKKDDLVTVSGNSKSYAVMAEDICGDTDRIYNMHKHDEGLARKNNAVAQMYAKVNSSDNPSDYDVLKAAAANQILEKLVFPSGFVILWSMKSLMPGTGQMISSIDRDEDSHVILFKNIFRSIKNQIIEEDQYDDSNFNETIYEIRDMIIDMAEEEKIWAKYASKGLLGFSEAAIDKYVEFKANAVCKNLKIDNIYPESNGGPLYSIEVENSLLIGDKKTNFFETQVVDYSVGSLQGDF